MRFLFSLFSLFLFLFNTLFWGLLIHPLILVKLLVPSASMQRLCTRLMIRMGESWIAINSWNLKVTQSIRWDIRMPEGLSVGRNYLVLANHQSWVDIVALQHIFNRRIPFLRFFLKKNLMYIPILGPVWWGFDYPFMNRYSREYLLKHPEKKDEDLQRILRSCERFKLSPVSILSFVEGTRRTDAKMREQSSNFKHLLKPKAGGLAFAIEGLGHSFDSLLNVTILYPNGVKSLWESFQGKLDHVVIDVERIQIPPEFLGKSYSENEEFKIKFQNWLIQLWTEKDQKMDSLLNPP